MPSGTWALGWAVGDIVTSAEFKKGVGAIYDTTLGAAAASVDIQNIIGGYAHLLVVVYARTNSGTAAELRMRFNNDTGGNYDYQVLDGSAATAQAAETFAATGARVGLIPGTSAGANLFAQVEILIPHYAGSANNKAGCSTCAAKWGTSSGQMQAELDAFFWRSNAAINQLTLYGTGNLVAGTRVTVYALGA